MFATRNFFAFQPLSNWIRGFDRYRGAFDKARLPRSRYPDCFYLLAADAPAAHVAQAWERTRDLVGRLGIPGDRVIALRAALPATSEAGPMPGVAQPNRHTGTGVGWRWPSPVLPLAGQGFAPAPDGIKDQPHEALTAAAFALPDRTLHAWADCAPRSFSVLPVARACNARCAFCFSRASVSRAVVPAALDLEAIDRHARAAAARGAHRAVITGGGEPTLLDPEAMTDLIATLAAHFSSVLLITNGSRLAPPPAPGTGRRLAPARGPAAAFADPLAVLARWRAAGLTRVALSRHGTTPAQDAAIMGLAVPTDQALARIQEAGLAARIICVLQKGGVDSPDALRQSLARAAAQGVAEVCFKELYVSALSENTWAQSRENAYCQAHQVPLAMATAALEGLGFGVATRLPWGSPVYEGAIGGQPMRVAAYTEPSVGFERTTGLVRSWNLMADGTCLASLEDPASRIDLAPG